MAIDDLIIKSQYGLHVHKLCSKQGFFIFQLVAANEPMVLSIR